MNQNYFEPNPSYNSNYSGFDRPLQYPINQSPSQEISIQDMEKITKEKELRQREQAVNLSTYTAEPSRRFNSIYYDDDDDEESTIHLNEIISQLPLSIAITPILPTMEPNDSLIMGDENLSTIPEKESNEVINYSVENLVPIKSESEDTSNNDSECDLPFCDDFPPLGIKRHNEIKENLQCVLAKQRQKGSMSLSTALAYQR
ncbi:hypothetical protein Tco_1407297 [Tanacetum coccineum]